MHAQFHEQSVVHHSTYRCWFMIEFEKKRVPSYLPTFILFSCAALDAIEITCLNQVCPKFMFSEPSFGPGFCIYCTYGAGSVYMQRACCDETVKSLVGSSTQSEAGFIDSPKA